MTYSQAEEWLKAVGWASSIRAGHLSAETSEWVTGYAIAEVCSEHAQLRANICRLPGETGLVAGHVARQIWRHALRIAALIELYPPVESLLSFED